MSFGDGGLCVLCYLRCSQGCAFLPELGLCRTGSVVLPLPLDRNFLWCTRVWAAGLGPSWVYQGCAGGAGSSPGWHWGTHSPAPITTARLLPLGSVPALFPANNTREEAECCCPEPSRAHSPPAHPPPPHPPPPSPPSGALCARGCCHLSVLAHPGCPSAMPCIFASGRCQNLHHFHLCAQWHQFSSLRLFLLMTTGVCTRSSHVGGKNSL